MTSSNILSTKFYQKENSFKKFDELDEEQLSTISKKVYKMEENMISNLSHSSAKISKYERYQKALHYLTNHRIYFDLKTFDERIAFLIIMVDPNLVTFKEFLKIDLISTSEIDKLEDELDKNRLNMLRKQNLSKYESAVREKIGFFDIKLLKYEEIFFKKFFSEKELITEIERNNLNNLIIKAKLLKNFNNISQERYEELIFIANTWLLLVKEKKNHKIAAYNITNQYKLLGLNNIQEQLALFILLIDNNLDMLRIYEEESRMKIIEKRIIEEFGYYNEELLVLERKFHDRFCPEKELSIWSKVKRR